MKDDNVMAQPWHCRQIPNGNQPIVVCERETLWAEIERLRAEVERLTADPMIYKHQCGHCSRFSPLPFLIPGYLMGGPS